MESAHNHKLIEKPFGVALPIQTADEYRLRCGDDRPDADRAQKTLRAAADEN
jgi:hypothetical protein